ncbi:hypothetical protein QTP70_011951 [Hemibagrus guttatus]|uniref:ribonuclease H n=1 Tax=Hemibagrus guttatus TaxID=175788 RepID=A0AAE0R3S8_9TELE|nr:hypothetical protein QTP70_011951 [Hemibagrus guttatus]
MGLRSLRVVNQLLHHWRSALTSEERVQMMDYQHTETGPAEDEPFPRLNIAPDIDGCAGPLLECRGEGEMDFRSANGTSHFCLQRHDITEYLADHGSSRAIVQQGAIIRSYQNQVEALHNQLCSASAAALWDVPLPCGESPRLALPEKFDGSVDRCRGFLRQCEVGGAGTPTLWVDEAVLRLWVLWSPEPPVPGEAHPALIDSVNLIDGALVEGLGIPTSPCVPSLRIMAIDSQPIGEGYLRCQTELLGFQVGLSHYERLAFYVTSSPANPMILGFLWLRHHDPQISWRKGELVCWSPTCLRKCLRDPVAMPCRTSCIEEANLIAHGHLPKPYVDFREVFSEERAAHLPAHQAWDCAIDLLPNTSLPKGWIYPLSLPASKAMEDYIEGALAAGHIWPSTSLAAAGFFFIGKKDGGLCPCIDYRGLNAITVRYPYPLPLVPAALEQLRGARVFTKLDLQSAYNLICIQEGDEWKTTFHTTHSNYKYCVMPFGLTNAPTVFQALINGVFQDLLGRNVIAYIDDILVYSASMEDNVRQVREVLARLQRHHLYVKLEKCEFHRSTVTFLGYVISHQGVEMDVGKVRAVTEWPAPATVWELQRFLGFANFYRRFIQSYSLVAGPLTSLVRGKPKKLTWTDPARAAFQQLKSCFTTAPILWNPDPDRPFVVEVDTSSSGLGLVLSQ